MKNELKKLIEKIKYNEKEEETDKIIGIYNVDCDYLKNYKKIGVSTYSDMYYQLEDSNTADMYSELYEYLEEKEKEQEELTEEDYKNIILKYSRTGRRGGVINEIEFLSDEILKNVEETTNDFENGYLEEEEFLETIEDNLSDLKSINNKIALEIKAILNNLVIK